ncbi:MAG: response regulator [Geobacter sp.]|nr:response regulator [Geobacter sp.]
MNELKELGVLVVVDDDAIFTAIARMFSHFKAKVDYAPSALEALDRLMTHEYKTIITNVDMPGMEGLELTRKARELIPALNIVLFTGDTAEQVLNLALNPKVLDMSEQQMKPCSLGEILKGIMNRETGRIFLLK